MKTKHIQSLATLLTLSAITAYAGRGRVMDAQQLNLNLRQIRNAQHQGIDFRQNAAPLGAPELGRELTAKNVRATVEGTVRYLQNLQKEDGSIGEQGYAAGGITALSALTMLAAGASPASDDSLRRALDYLATVSPDNTYVRGIRANVWEYALRRVPHDKAIRKLLREDFEWLKAALGDKQGWRYTKNSRDWDNSVTQYGVLGLWAAARAGMDPGDAFWLKMSKHFRDVQNSDGGWGYQRSGSTANMATAGLATMFLVFDMVHGRQAYTQENPRAFQEGEAKSVLDSIDRGMNWLSKSGGSYRDGYFLYGIERTGVAGGRRVIGSHDWFAEGARSVLSLRRSDGSIGVSGHGGTVGGAAFSALFLVYGGAPVAFNKLQYGDDANWNLNPRDLANLTKHLWSAYERPLNWQTVDIAAPVEEFEAPVLFISGARAPEFSDAHVETLRAYIERGGTILAEPTDGSAAFKQAMVSLVARLYDPERFPNRSLEALPADHPVYTVLRQSWGARPALQGVSDGARTVFFLSDDYLSAEWQRNRVDGDAFQLPMNLLFYATDMKALKGRFASSLPITAAAAPREEALRVARVRLSSGEERNRGVWSRLAPYVRHVTGCGLEALEDVSLGESETTGIDLLHMTGMNDFSLNDAQAVALSAFLDAGGTLLVDAYSGATPFAAAARRELGARLGALEPLSDDSILGAGRMAGGVNLTKGIRYTMAARRELRSQSASTTRHALEVIMRDGRPAVVFSRFDLTAALSGTDIYQGKGYQPASARKIAGNLVALLKAE